MLKKVFKSFVLLLTTYIFLMIVSFSIPNKYVEKNVQESISLINNEGMYPSLNKSDRGSRLDNFTDRIMFDKSIKDQTNPVKAAMSVNDYSRYWHGYQVLLRPLLIFISYGNIRQMYGLILMILIGLNFYFLTKKLDVFIALAFLISLYSVRFYTFFLSMQFSNVFIIMLIFNLFLLSRKTSMLKKNFYLPFFIVGSITNFIDLLTVPMITLGIPLVLVLYSEVSSTSSGQNLTIQYLFKILFSSIFWGIGYGLTWFSKWCVASILLRKNVILDALNKALFRTEGNKEYPLNRSEMLHNNLGLILNKFCLVVFTLFIIFVVVMVFYKKNLLRRYLNKNALYLITVALLPYTWYEVLANHSQIHYWFTYRLQFVSVFAILSFLSYIIRTLFIKKNGEFKL